MRDRTWYRRGPNLFGYQPGWLWWALMLIVVVGGGTLVVRQFQRHRASERYVAQLVEKHANAQGLPVELVAAVVEAESGGDSLAESDAGARGLMQVTPIALEDVRRREGLPAGDLFDPEYNMRVGTLYLKHLMDRFDGDPALAVAAYHMGPTGVARGLRGHPGLTPREMIETHAGPKTRAYVERVLGLAGYE